MWQMSKAYGVRPSTFLAVEEPLAAFYLDRAVASFGMAVETDLEKVGESRKSRQAKAMAVQSRMNTWLGPEGARFRDPVRR